MLRCQIEIVNDSKLKWRVWEQSTEWYEPWPVGVRYDDSAGYAVEVKGRYPLGYSKVRVSSLGGPEVRISGTSDSLRVWLFLRGNHSGFDFEPSVRGGLNHSEAIQVQRSIVTALVAVGRRLDLNVEVTC